MRIQQLQAFVAVVEAGSIRGGARRLGLSQPALTKSIRLLEEELGASLLQRSVNGIAVTQFGRALGARAQLIVSEMQRIHADIDQLQGGDQGSVAIGLSPTAALLMVDRALRQLRLLHPGVRVRIVDGTYDSVHGQLRNGALDFTIGPLPVPPDVTDLDATPLFHCNLVAVVRRGHKLAGATSLDQLLDLTWIWPGDGSGGVAAMIFADRAKPRPAPIFCSSLPARLQLVLCNDCVMLIPDRMVRHPLFADRLQELKLDEPLPRAQYFLFQRQGTPLTPAAEALATEFRRLSRTLD